MSELRQDLISGDWVIIAPGRAKRPQFLETKRPPRTPAPKQSCPFEDLEKSGNWPPIAAYPNKAHWAIAVIQNKYPALTHDGTCATLIRHGLYSAKTGVGSHDLIITRDHNKSFADVDTATAVKVLEMIKERYRAAAKEGCSEYVIPFFNFGPASGASVWHPHYQVLALPAVPPHVIHSLHGAERYFKKNHRCVRCDIIKAERKEGKRVIEENEHAISFSPYASKFPFETSIMLRSHSPYFTKISPAATKSIALLLQSTLRRMKKYLNDPDLNFYIHDAPLGKEKYPYHHWHIQVMPRVSIAAGFEFSTDMYINTTDPNDAAAILRGK